MKDRKVMVITVGNIKGGVGKSTVVVNLAACAARDGLKPLIIDTDSPQYSSALWRAYRAERDQDDIKCIQITTATIANDIKELSAGFDIVIIDCGGRVDKIFRSAITAAGLTDGLLLIPVLPSIFDVQASGETIEILKEVLPVVDVKARFVINRVSPNTVIGSDVEVALDDYSTIVPVLGSRLMQHSGIDGYSMCLIGGRGVIETAPRGSAAQEMMALYNEIKTLLK
jgi:chromosome partitioning protein